MNIFYIVWMHWIADFCFQNDNMAKEKSKDFLVLGLHCFVYGAFMIGFGWKFALLNAIAHFLVDGVTSRMTSHLYAKGDRHNFFVVIGLDQAIHMTILIASAKYWGLI